MNITMLHALGFDLSEPVPRTRPKRFRVRCSHCAAAVINGVPSHELGCPNAMHECHGCAALVPARVKYCSDCL